MKQFGQLTTFQSMENYFQKCRLQSRQTLLKRLYAHDEKAKKGKDISKKDIVREYSSLGRHDNNIMRQSDDRLKNEIAETFQNIIQWTDFDLNNSIVKQVSRIFGLNLEYLKRKSKQDKRIYILERIYEQIEKNLQTGFSGFQSSSENFQIGEKTNKKQNPQEKQDAFSWLNITTKYSSLKPIFEEILIERVKLFDNQLSQLTELSRQNINTTSQIISTCRTISFPAQSTRLNRSLSSVSTINMKKQLKNKLIDEKLGFCNVKIRDNSKFSLDKWTEKQQKQFQVKKNEYKARQAKIENNPILFQFVKKYTKTVKARQNIFQKWSNRQKSDITPEQIKYLCATSLFLNQSLTQSEKVRHKQNIKSAGKQLISKLEFNIAEHIIQTYKIFMKKVFDLRAGYYQTLTEKRKTEYNINKKKQQKSEQASKRAELLKKNIKMYKTIVESEKMRMKLNTKVFRWVKLFCQKLKQRSKIRSKNLERIGSLIFVKNMQKKKVNSFFAAMKKSSPSAKILKRESHESYRSETKRYVEAQKFYYQPQFENAIDKFNKLKLKGNRQTVSSAYRKQLSGGPAPDRRQIHVNLSKKTINYDSKQCLQQIIKVQSIWRLIYYKKQYISMRDEHRKELEQDFQQKYERLWKLYPLGKKINFNQIKNRLKRVSMRINNLAQPYVRSYKKSINLYTCFSKYKFCLSQLKLKYSKLNSSRLSELIRLIEQNRYGTIVQNGYVISQKQINSGLCKQGGSMLWWSVRNSNLQLVKKLLEGGGNPNSKNIQHSTCLHQAMKKGDIEIIFILIDYGGDLNAKNNKKQTPLYFATNKMLKLLGLQQGASNYNDDTNSLIDNNSLFFKPNVQEICPDHYY